MSEYADFSQLLQAHLKRLNCPKVDGKIQIEVDYPHVRDIFDLNGLLGEGTFVAENVDYTIRVLWGSCGDDETCPMLGTVPARPGKVQGVARLVTEPDLLAAYARHIGPGEALFEMDEGMIFGVTG
ncbi:hypothetical protein [Pseudonocardia spinosispora]|uniref:hypothetical protein n=1 Tax=Pseudonocardia spinosispora TaxID=103441 RepID=UPI000490D419|nr:hypothetical protein [Pseudonocardia spinosispora]